MSGILRFCGSLLLLAAANLAVAWLLSNTQSANGDMVQLTPEQLQLAVGQGTSCTFYQYKTGAYCAFCTANCKPAPKPSDCCDPTIPDFYGCNDVMELIFWPVGPIHGEGPPGFAHCPVMTTTKLPCVCGSNGCGFGMPYTDTCQSPDFYRTISGC